MNDRELTRAVWQDLVVIKETSTLARLHQEYDKERRKKKISAESTYQRFYPIRTKAKNNWIIMLQKTPDVPRYRNIDDTAYYPIVYYFGPKGFNVFKPDEAAGLLFVYQGHVFTRYCRRMQLPFTEPLEKIHHFFTYNAGAEHQVVAHKDRSFSIGICRDGALLGELREDVKWVFNRTFVNREAFRRYQHRIERQLAEETDAFVQVINERWKGQHILKQACTMMSNLRETIHSPFILPANTR